jgi:phosphatidylinositol alpha-1,6-mannosyltransferase
MRERALEVIGLFPSFDSERFGGVQTSGRDAWQCIVTQFGKQRTEAIYYKAGDSKFQAVLRAARSGRGAQFVLVWHLHLLKLLPFLNRSKSRVVVFIHGIEAWRKQDPLTRILLRRVHLILSNSDHTWHRFLSCNPEFKDVPHRTVHLGAGSPVEGVTPRPSQTPVILMIGRLSKRENYKGHRQMIEAWPAVLQRVPRAQLWIVGDGDLRSTLEELSVSRGLNHAVQFYGHVPDSEKERLIEQCRCLALPSSGEGFGLVYLEAMRLGRPCLVSNLDAGREVVNPPEAGISVDPGDTEQIVEAIHRLLSSGIEWDQWSSRARNRYEHRFTGQQFQERLGSALVPSSI